MIKNKPLATPLLIERAYEAGWSEERIRDTFEIPAPPDEEIVSQCAAQFMKQGGNGMSWISVDTELPEKDTDVLGGWWENGDWSCEVVTFSGSSKPEYRFDSVSDAGMYPPVSHWMPLPKPPAPPAKRS